MDAAISGGVSWGMGGDAADDMDEEDMPPGGPVDWRSYSQTHTLTDKQQKTATKLRRLENRVMNLSRELERIRVRIAWCYCCDSYSCQRQQSIACQSCKSCHVNAGGFCCICLGEASWWQPVVTDWQKELAHRFAVHGNDSVLLLHGQPKGS